MRPKGKLLTLIALFAAVGLITATGAFTTVEAERTATIETAGDADALLGLQAAGDISNEDIVDDSEDTITIDLSDENLGDAEGLNLNATTTFNPLIQIANNGEQDIELTVGVEESDDIEIITVDEEGEEFSEETIGAGETTDIGLKIETGDDVTEFNIDITFTAESTE